MCNLRVNNRCILRCLHYQKKAVGFISQIVPVTDEVAYTTKELRL